MSQPDPSSARIPGPWQHRDVHANGIRLHIAELGAGPLVLMIHDHHAFWWQHRHLLEPVAAAGFRAVAVDLRGYGDSDKPPRGYDGWTLGTDIAGLIRALGESEADLIGAGWGGVGAFAVAELQPQWVRSLVALAAPHPAALRRAVYAAPSRRRGVIADVLRLQLPWLPEWRATRRSGAATAERISRLSGPTWRATPDFAAAVTRYREASLIPQVAHSAAEYQRWIARSQLRPDGARFARQVRGQLAVPVLAIAGARDRLFSPDLVAQTASFAPDFRCQVVPDAGHLLTEEVPDAVADAVIDFLRRRRL